MTIEEALAIYPTKEYYPSYGDTITKIVDRLYESRDDIYFYIITVLNPLVKDWWPSWKQESGVLVGLPTSIKYFPKEICQKIYEVTG